MARKETSLKEGDVLAGRYTVDRVIAVGGMGIVVAARHVQLGNRVAIKLLHPDLLSPQATARFLTEAKASALLRSEHVVKVGDVGQLETGEPFMVMELLEGANLADELATGGAMPAPRAVEYVLQALEGIAEAHAARIVHRDLKPENLFRVVRPNGSSLVKVLDFGVSKALSQDVRVEGTVTQGDAVFGSPLYMSPEQMTAATKADERSDIWSIGVVLYELVTGRTPFEAENMAGLAVAIATQPPRRLRGDAPAAPPELEAVIEKCLQKDPALRYPNVGELAADLEPFAPASRHHVEAIQRLVAGGALPPRAVPAAPPSTRNVAPGAETLSPEAQLSGAFSIPPKRRSWLPFALAGTAFVAVGAVGLVLLTIFRTTPPAAGSVSSTPSPVGSTHSDITSQPLATVTNGPTVTAPPAASATPSVAATSVRPGILHPVPLASASARASASAVPVATTVAPPSTAAPSSTLITGISHDRK